MTQDEAIELGREIALHGREKFVHEFRKSLTKGNPQQQQTGIQSWPASVRYALLAPILLFALFGLASMPARGWIPLFALMAIVMGIYGISAWFAYRRFCRWVDSLIANYAAHVARGGR